VSGGGGTAREGGCGRSGRELDLAEATVKVHVRSILRTLDASSRTEAVVAASRLGLNAANMRGSNRSDD